MCKRILTVISLLLFVQVTYAQDWVQNGQILNAEDSFDYFGTDISLSKNGQTIAIGAENNDGNGKNSGHVRVFEMVDSKWVQKGSDIDGDLVEDQFGSAISLSDNGNTLAIGSINSHLNGKWSGHVRIFQWNGSTWKQLGNDIEGESGNNHSGYDVSLSADGSLVAISAPWNNASDTFVGHVRVYHWIDSSWVQRGLDIDGLDRNDLF
ncbi:MAG: hypothetical protein ACI9UJ_002391, partial [bacterium]